MIPIGVPTASMIAATAAAKSQKNTLEILLHLQKMLDEFRDKVIETEERMYAMKVENHILKTKIYELTKQSSS